LVIKAVLSVPVSGSALTLMRIRNVANNLASLHLATVCYASLIATGIEIENRRFIFVLKKS
jgi:hypothetical protein